MIAALCSTDPPMDYESLPRTTEGPPCLLLPAFGLSFAGIIVGPTIVLVVGKSNSTWFRDMSREVFYWCRGTVVSGIRG